MTSYATRLAGRCHCGNLELDFETNLSIAELPVRADSCSFCSKHGARTTSDPRGRVRIVVHDPAELIRYRFALRTADFLVCRRCGIYLAAVLTAGGSSWATLNVNALHRSSEFTKAAVPVSYEGETVAGRIARRRANWTPVAGIAEDA